MPAVRDAACRETEHLSGLLAIGGVAAFLSIVVALHVLQPEYDPRHQLVSELARGRFGWAMLPAFAALGGGVAAISSGLRACRASFLVRGALLVSTFSFVFAGLFPLGRADLLHITFVALGFVGVALAMVLAPLHTELLDSASGRRLSWSCAAAMVTSVGVAANWLPDAIAQRLAATWLLAWLVAVGLRLRRT